MIPELIVASMLAYVTLRLAWVAFGPTPLNHARRHGSSSGGHGSANARRTT
jgi:hypothetical protein